MVRYQWLVAEAPVDRRAPGRLGVRPESRRKTWRHCTSMPVVFELPLWVPWEGLRQPQREKCPPPTASPQAELLPFYWFCELGLHMRFHLKNVLQNKFKP